MYIYIYPAYSTNFLKDLHYFLKILLVHHMSRPVNKENPAHVVIV